eukprot:1350897-Amorphochlora_amoeboformis.AAC.2
MGLTASPCRCSKAGIRALSYSLSDRNCNLRIVRSISADTTTVDLRNKGFNRQLHSSNPIPEEQEGKIGELKNEIQKFGRI